MTMIAGPVTIDAARLAYLERVEKAAAHELLMDEAVQRHAARYTLAVGLSGDWRREEVTLLTGRRAALDALHAALAARPPAADTETPNG
jgi:hypothetical protein